MTPTYEVERKWVLKTIPSVCSNLDPIRITQAYLEGVRIRRANNNYFITVKGHGDIARLEWEQEIPRWVFEQLIVGTGAIVEKERFILQRAEPTIAVDVFGGKLGGLVLLEAEWLASNDLECVIFTANNYELPNWIKGAIEVTNDKRFNNASLAIYQTIPRAV